MMTNEKTTTSDIRKGNHVYLFYSWNDKGTFAWYEYTVDSAGSQQIHLRSNDGEMLKRRIYPNASNQHLRLSSEVSNPAAVAIDYAAAYLIRETTDCEERINRHSDNLPYVRNLNERLNVLRSAIPGQIQKRF